MRNALKAGLLLFLATSGLAIAEDATRTRMGEDFVFCSQVIIAVDRKGGVSERTLSTGNGAMMAALGSYLLGINSVEELKPHLDAARATLATEAGAPDGVMRLLEAYANCMTLYKKEGPALIEQFKRDRALPEKQPETR